jgi:inosine-uridine nucleoside N-ribohydrolase
VHQPNSFIWATWTAAGSEYLERLDAASPFDDSVLDISHTRSSASNPLAAAVALEEGPQLVATRAATVDVELTGTLTRGMTVTD